MAYTEVLNSPFTDTNAVHTYRVDGGSTCGLLVIIWVTGSRSGVNAFCIS
jgi:hypothetical protein